MGRLYQHHAFRSQDLRGRLIEEARYWRKGTSGDARCSMLWLKPSGRLWQRFFLDATAVFWEEWEDEVTFETFDDLDDGLEQVEALRGVELGEVEAAQFGGESSGLRIGLGRNGALWLLPIDPHDLESDACLTFALPTE